MGDIYGGSGSNDFGDGGDNSIGNGIQPLEDRNPSSGSSGGIVDEVDWFDGREDEIEWVDDDLIDGGWNDDVEENLPAENTVDLIEISDGLIGVPIEDVSDISQFKSYVAVSYTHLRAHET